MDQKILKMMQDMNKDGAAMFIFLPSYENLKFERGFFRQNFFICITDPKILFQYIGFKKKCEFSHLELFLTNPVYK